MLHRPDMTMLSCVACTISSKPDCTAHTAAVPHQPHCIALPHDLSSIFSKRTIYHTYLPVCHPFYSPSTNAPSPSIVTPTTGVRIQAFWCYTTGVAIPNTGVSIPTTDLSISTIGDIYKPLGCLSGTPHYAAKQPLSLLFLSSVNTFHRSLV